jgi:hypothetical protein
MFNFEIKKEAVLKSQFSVKLSINKFSSNPSTPLRMTMSIR